MKLLYRYNQTYVSKLTRELAIYHAHKLYDGPLAAKICRDVEGVTEFRQPTEMD